MAQNYTRQSTLSDGDTITASLFNDEYNQLVNAFTYSSTSASSTGHRHDGSAGQGGNIFKIGDLDFLNKIEVDSTNNRWGFYVEVSSAAVEQIRIQDGSIVPVTTNDIDLGTASLQFKDLYIDGTANVDSLTLTSGATVTTILDEDDLSSDSATALVTQQSVKAYIDAQVTAQDFDFQADSGGALSIDLDSETMTFTGGTGIDTSGSGNAVTFAIDSTVTTLTGTQTLTNKTLTTPVISTISNTGTLTLPTSTDTLVGRATTDTLTNKTLTSPDINTPDIDGGTIDGATIATSDITVGTGKTLDVSSGTLTLADNQISGDKVEGGTIASTTITSLASTTVDTTNLEVTNIKAKDGTSAGSIADSTGVVTLASSVLTTTDINGGTIDGATIGGTTAAAGSFTTVSATGNITVGGTVDGRDVATDGTKLDGIEASADVTDTANVTAAGALMDSELTSESSVKALNQGVATTDSPTFAGVTVNGTVEFDGLSGTGAVSVTDILDQDDMSSNSATALATQQSIKAYVDSQVATADALSEVLGNGNTTGGTDIAVGTGDDITFTDSSKAIFGAGSDLLIYHDGSNSYISEAGTGSLRIRSNQVRLEAPDSQNMVIVTEDAGVQAFYNGTERLTVTNTGIDVTGVITTDGMTTSADINFGDNDKAVFGAGSDLQIYHDGTDNVFDSSTTFTFDGETEGKLTFKDSGTSYGRIDSNGAAGFDITSEIQDGDLRLRGNDGGSTINALTLDMSAAGAATFSGAITANAGVVVDTITIDGSTVASTGSLGLDIGGNLTIDVDGTTITLADGGLNWGQMFNSSQNFYFKNPTSDKDILFQGIDGGVVLTALTFDMSNAGSAIFNASGTFNEVGGDHDFRVESDGLSHALFVDASTDKIGIGESAPATYLDIAFTSLDQTDGIQIHNKQFGGYGGAVEWISRTAASLGGGSDRIAGQIQVAGANNWASDDNVESTMKFSLVEDNTLRNTLELNPSSEVVINQDSIDMDFRVESDNQANMLVVDASADKVGIGGSAGDTTLTVRGSNNSAGDLYTAVGAGNVPGIVVQNAGTTDNNNAAVFFKNDAAVVASIGARFNSHSTEETELRLSTTNSSGTTRERVFIQGDGDFGIGAQPSYKLDVVDSATLSARIHATGNNTRATGLYQAHTSGGDDVNMSIGVFGDASRGELSTATNHTLRLYVNNTPSKYLEIATTGQIFTSHGMIVNEDSNDSDFRVESNNNTHMLYVDGQDHVNIGTSSDYGKALNVLGGLEVRGTGDTIELQQSSAGSATYYAMDNSVETGGKRWRFGYTGASSDKASFTFYNNTDDEVPLFMGAGRINLNHSSDDVDTVIKSSNNSDMFYVDAGNDRIGIGTGTPAVRAHLYQAVEANELFRIEQGTSGRGAQINFKNPHNSTTYIGLAGDTTGDVIYYNGTASDNIFYTGGTERMRQNATETVINDISGDVDFRVESDSDANAFFVDASTSRVGINKSNPGAHLHITGNNESDGASLKLQEANNNTSDTLGTIFFGNNSADQLGRIIGFTSGTATTCTLRFMSTSNGGTTVNNLDLASSNVTFNENGADCDFRVESDNSSYGIYLDAANDRLLVGRGDVSTGEDFFAVDVRPGTTGHVVRTGRDDNSTKNHFVFLNPNGTVGSIQTTGSSTLFNTSSDARLKENIADADDAGALIDAIQVRQFDWIVDGEHQRYGMVAQELNTVAPEAVSEGETEDDMMGVDYSKLVPMLVKEIQSLRARVAQLESN